MSNCSHWPSASWDGSCLSLLLPSIITLLQIICSFWVEGSNYSYFLSLLRLDLQQKPSFELSRKLAAETNRFRGFPMDSEAEALEEKLTSLFGQLRAECAILERVVYKNKNQHRRSSYFQYLMKVRRDLRLLQSTKLEEILGCCFQSITGKRPKQKVHLLESLKRRKCESGKYNFMERLLGVARLLSQGAIQISALLARSFFMGFSLTILALLARLRVVVQQILLDVVSVFNMVSSLSQKKQSVKINKKGVEFFREFYPTQEDFITLECVWKSDKFDLLERTQKSQIASPGVDLSLWTSSVLYRSIESSLGDDEIMSERPDEKHTVELDQVQVPRMVNTKAKESRFTLHGLWPFNATQLDPNNINSDFQYTPIIECAQLPTSFQASQLPTALLTDLAKSWKSYKRSLPNHDFWKDEYDKHGTCTVKKFPSPAEYFQKANHLWLANPIEDWFRRIGRFTDKDVPLAELTGAIFNEFGYVPWFQCQDKLVRQIGLCLDEVGGQGANCPKEYQKHPCPATVQYRL